MPFKKTVDQAVSMELRDWREGDFRKYDGVVVVVGPLRFTLMVDKDLRALATGVSAADYFNDAGMFQSGKCCG